MNSYFSNTLSTFILFTSFTTIADAALVSRLGGQAVYDTEQNITWLADANLAASNSFGLPVDTNTDPFVEQPIGSVTYYGLMHVSTTDTFINAMNTSSYLGASTWRLPTLMQPDLTCSVQGTYGQSVGYGCENGEMAHLFIELGGNEFGLNRSTNPDVALFSNVMETWAYISGTQYTPFEGAVTSNFTYSFANGYQTTAYPTGSGFIWAVADGDVFVSTVPVPATVWLLGSGLIGLFATAMKRRKI